MDVIVAIMPLVAGYCLDLSLGDPLWLPHPVVGFGHMISACERRLNRGGHRVAKGAFTVIGLVLSVYMAVEIDKIHFRSGPFARNGNVFNSLTFWKE